MIHVLRPRIAMEQRQDFQTFSCFKPFSCVLICGASFEEEHSLSRIPYRIVNKQKKILKLKKVETSKP